MSSQRVIPPSIELWQHQIATFKQKFSWTFSPSTPQSHAAETYTSELIYFDSWRLNEWLNRWSNCYGYKVDILERHIAKEPNLFQSIFRARLFFYRL